MKKELQNECERLENGFSGPSNDVNGKQSFAIGFWKGVDTLTRLQQENEETKILLSAKDALKLSNSVKCKAKPTTDRFLTSVLKKIQIHAEDGFTGMFIKAYKLDDDTITKLQELGYTLEKTIDYDEENFPENMYHISWSDEEIFSEETLKSIFGNDIGTELYNKTKG